MKITTKTTRAELAAWIKEQDSLIEALKVTRDELRKAKDAAEAELIAVRHAVAYRVDQMGDNKPWKLAGIALVTGIVIGWVGNGVL